MADSRWLEYERQKRQWLNEHPDATSKEIEEFCIELAKKLRV